MQTGIWMVNSDSMHLSEQFSYKTLFIPSYKLEDMNLARFHICNNFQKNRDKAGAFLTHRILAGEADSWSRGS
jgi:hypothetical protein